MHGSAQPDQMVIIIINIFYETFSSWQQKRLANMKSFKKQNHWWTPDSPIMQKQSRALWRWFQSCSNATLQWCNFTDRSRAETYAEAPRRIAMPFRMKYYLVRLALLLPLNLCLIRLMITPRHWHRLWSFFTYALWWEWQRFLHPSTYPHSLPPIPLIPWMIHLFSKE